MDREGFRNRLKQYKEAKGFDPLLKYLEWKLKYDAAPQPDSMPSLPQPDLVTPVSQQLENRAHRWDNGYAQTNRQSLDSPYEDARYYDYRKPRFEFRKGDVHYSNPNLLKFMGRFGKVMRGGSLLGETILNLFPSEEAERIEDLRVKMDKWNKQLTGLEDIPKYADGTDGVTLKEKEDAFWRGDTQKMAELVEREGKQLTYVTPQSNLNEVVVTANKPKQNTYSELDFAKDVVSFTPLGDAIDLYDAGKELYKGNYTNAAMLGAGLLLPNWLEKSGKLGYRYLRKMASKKFGASNVEFYENLARDVITKPKETYAARKEGRYPLTFTERRKYLDQVHEADYFYRKSLMDTNKNDYFYRLNMFPDNPFVSTNEWRRTTIRPNTKLNLKNTFNSRSFGNFANPNDAQGINNIDWNINSHIALRNSKSNILKKPSDVAGTAIHERQHSVSNNLPDFHSLSTYSPEMDYFTYAGERGIIPEMEKILLPLNKNAGVNDWASSPAEWFSEAMEYRVRATDGKPFREMSESERERFINYMHLSFGDNLSKYEIAKILADGSTLGYF